jgi:hypothetical protein
VKRLCADDSAATSVKVGYRQASYKKKTPAEMLGFFFVCWYYTAPRLRKAMVKTHGDRRQKWSTALTS